LEDAERSFQEPHSGSERIEVEVSITPRQVTARVREQGVGLVALGAEDGTTEGGLGLSSIKERVWLLGGSFWLVPEPGGGVRAELKLPLMRDKGR
jgi:signal transduction histidine kinase